MPHEARILPDMLLTVFKKGYFCYIIALCYVIIALMSAFCLHCHTTKQRMKRESLTSCGRYCLDCTPNGVCRNCSGGRLFFVYENVAKCAHSCPKYYHTRYSKILPSSCKRCKNPYCESCDGSPSHCAQCSRNSFLHKGTCLKSCPEGFRKHKRRPRCIPRKAKCELGPWIPTKSRNCSCIDGMWRKITKTREVIKPGKKCNKKKLRRSRLCRAPYGGRCHSLTDPNTNRRRQPKKPTPNNSRTPLLYGYTTRNRQLERNLSLNNYKDPRRSTRTRSKRLISIMTSTT